MPTKARLVFAIAITVTFAVSAAMYVVRAPIRNAAKIQRGDTAAKVYKLLGAPTAVFKTTTELRASSLGPVSYVFTDRSGRRGIRLDELPPVVTSAEWFEYASAGHLVYYDDRGVTEVFWAAVTHDLRCR